MEGIIWLFLAQVVALVVLGDMVVGLRRRSGSVNPNPGRCSKCATPMSLRRVSIFESLTFRGVWMCPHCGNRIKSRKGVAGTAA
jgi:DNA-directed RNA polymerase subunit RPC12/RpoP